MNHSKDRDLEYEILNMLLDAGGYVDRSDLASKFDDVSYEFQLEQSHLFKCGYISESMDSSKIRIIPKGNARLSELEQIRAQNAERKKQQSFENKISIANVLVPFVTFILGVFVEHWAGIVDWVLYLFH